ncbi:inverse autotransporter beta domain-containing protein [Photorhabdus tasmaniensis]|uniref:inverse autotransporter beta domain-containing protein n=1 Tax=Photorhabdus sp. RM323S TaxID=3342828 RepID=UPI0036DB938F
MNKKIGYVSAISVALLLASCYKPNKKKEPVVQEENLNTIGSEHKRKKRWLQPQTDENVKQGGDIPKLGTEKDSAGEVRANLPLSDGELTSGSIDLFYPLYDGDERILFGQAGARRFDGRSIVNLGVGQRHFQGDWAIGYNTFYDAQISGNAHQRLGIGLEYWRDYLHLAANGYFGLTDWHSSSALNGYAERVANGYDIRAQGWLPSYPQLSGKLKFEQYFGDDVALFNHENRYKDPRVLTVGLDYTPIPLISLGVDRTFSHSGKDDTKVGLSFNYQLGVPLSQQIDPTTAPVRRTLADNRHRLVERNNNIVLKHRERSQLSLNLPTILSGFGGERKLINFSFNGKYRLKYIQWDDSVLRARGGRIVPLSDNSYAVHFPRYSSQQSNHLTISAMAHDEQENISNSSEMVILINEPVVLSAPAIELVEDDESELVMRTGEGDEEPPLLEEREEQQELEQGQLEQERLEQEYSEQERLERERLEQEQLEQERLERERLEQEQLEQERLERERLEQVQLEQERLERERLEQEQLEQERLEREHLEQERLEHEQRQPAGPPPPPLPQGGFQGGTGGPQGGTGRSQVGTGEPQGGEDLMTELERKLKSRKTRSSEDIDKEQEGRRRMNRLSPEAKAIFEQTNRVLGNHVVHDDDDDSGDEWKDE